jgi:hypothetical protein
VEWQKVRITNVGTEPWDLLNVQTQWQETADPGGTCTVTPEGVVYDFGVQGPSGPLITILGRVIGVGGSPDPVDGALYSSLNDNHGVVAGSAQFRRLNTGGSVTSVHVEPGDYEDLLLGIRLPTSTPDSCVDVVWQLTTTWTVQTHIP